MKVLKTDLENRSIRYTENTHPYQTNPADIGRFILNCRGIYILFWIPIHSEVGNDCGISYLKIEHLVVNLYRLFDTFYLIFYQVFDIKKSSELLLSYCNNKIIIYEGRRKNVQKNILGSYFVQCLSL